VIRLVNAFRLRALFSNNGDLYVGEYDMDQRHGKGRYEWEDGRMYDGIFHRDQRQGTGTYSWADRVEQCILETSSLDNGMATVHTNSLTGQFMLVIGGRENTMVSVNVNGLTTDITAENGKTGVPTAMEKKRGPTAPYAMTEWKNDRPV
jgi:hypothetical protein